ncbi:MAG: RNHCP domain-containing protein [Oscillospiraceae bacterium]|nr:RNHCP domain-containing protein [Oscillospiraceae bacterium]
MESKRFIKNDNGFECANCGVKVEPLGYSSRNHCPKCLFSVHLDVNPGDRNADCGGLMKPERVELCPRDEYIIVHKCTHCGAVRRNKAAHRATKQPDDLRLLIRLTAIV